MNEATKTKRVLLEGELSILTGNGIDIGCGGDPINNTVRKFDIADGDANLITNYVNDQFDYVFSSHCLEHMDDPAVAINEWWRLVRPGGYLFVVVPDEDLYEQGVFPSRFNHDHKATFTISKCKSWCNKSYNLIDLAKALPNSEVISVRLCDINYDRRMLRFGHDSVFAPLITFALRCSRAIRRRGFAKLRFAEILASRFMAVDQTIFSEAMAQIHLIVKKNN